MLGIFDSGVGGLTVAAAIRRQAPDADLLYFGDVANAPYGPKSSEELFAITMRAMCFLRSHGVTDFVAACNSVSVSVIQPLIDIFGVQPIRLIEMVGPSARALRHQSSGKTVVIATQATVSSRMYERIFSRQGLSVEMMAVPALAFAIEQGRPQKEIQNIIGPVINKMIRTKAKTLVFGCTHFPLVRFLFEEELTRRGSKMVLFDPSDAVASEVVQAFDMRGNGLNTFFISNESDVFRAKVAILFGPQVNIEVTHVDNSVDNQWKENPFQACGLLSE